MEHQFGFPIEAIIILIVAVIGSAWLDLRNHKDGHEITFKNAALWSVFFICVSMLYYAYLYFRFDPEFANLFLAGYALEKALSADNMIVIMGIMAAFGISSSHMQHRILYFGIIGAILFRAIFIGAGSWLFSLGSLVQVFFGAIVVWTAWAMIKDGDDEDDDVDYTKHWSVKYIKNHFPVAQGLVGDKFFVTKAEADANGVVAEEHGNRVSRFISKLIFGGRYATVAFLCLICVEFSDITFSFDSVPAVLAVTKDPLLVYSAIIFAVLGLRSLYFLLKVAMQYLYYLKYAVAIVLVYVGFKLMIPFIYEYIPTVGNTLHIPEHIHHTTSLYIVLGLIASGIVISLILPKKQ